MQESQWTMLAGSGRDLPASPMTVVYPVRTAAGVFPKSRMTMPIRLEFEHN